MMGPLAAIFGGFGSQEINPPRPSRLVRVGLTLIAIVFFAITYPLIAIVLAVILGTSFIAAQFA